MNLDAGIHQPLHLRRDVGALFVHAQQVRAHVEISRVDRYILRRQPLFDHATHFVLSDRSQRRVVAVKKRQPHVFVAHEQRGPRRFRIAFTEAEKTFVRALPRHDLLETYAQLFGFVAFNIQLPILTAALAHVDGQFGFARGVKTKIEIVTHDAAIDAHDAIAAFQVQLRPNCSRRHFGDFDTATADLGYGWRDCKFVHEKLAFAGRARFGNSATDETASITNAPTVF